jgi:hypothetical protein
MIAHIATSAGGIGTMPGFHLEAGAKTPWKRVRCARGGGTRVAKRLKRQRLTSVGERALEANREAGERLLRRAQSCLSAPRTSPNGPRS